MLQWLHIKPPITLFQEEINIFSGNAIKFSRMSFGLILEVLNTINLILSLGKYFTMINAVMLKSSDAWCITGPPIICIDYATSSYFSV